MNRREALRTLAAGSAAGAVAAGAVLAVTPAEAVASVDPCLAFVNGWEVVGERCANLRPSEFEPYYTNHVQPFETVAAFGTIPAATTAKGAAAALRKALAFEDMDRQDANLIRAALSYLEGRTA